MANWDNDAYQASSKVCSDKNIKQTTRECVWMLLESLHIYGGVFIIPPIRVS